MKYTCHLDFGDNVFLQLSFILYVKICVYIYKSMIYAKGWGNLPVSLV